MRRPPPSVSRRAAWLALSLWLAGAGCGFSSTGNRPPGVDGGGGGLPDAAPTVDAPPGSATCLGPSGWQVCVAPVLGSRTLTGTIDTDTSSQCLGAPLVQWNAVQPEACFVVGESVTVAALKATGTRPLVIVATGPLTVTGVLDVASRRTGRGAASQSTECQLALRSPGLGGTPPAAGGGGGGAGGSFASRGGNGGAGDSDFHQSGLAADLDLGTPMRLRGGCAGQSGGGSDGTTSGGEAGAGGGAVYLVAGGRLAIMGTINASGGGGVGGNARNGGGGGGSGGMIILHGSPITTTAASVLLAVGGGGGGGGAATGPAVTARGSDGLDPLAATPLVAAAGGSAGLDATGNGGNGGNGFAIAASAVDGTGGAVDGGGGGGGGSIQANQALGDAAVSPPVTIR